MNTAKTGTSILQFVTDFVAINGYPPTQEEVFERIDLGDRRVAEYFLHALEVAGAITTMQIGPNLGTCLISPMPARNGQSPRGLARGVEIRGAILDFVSRFVTRMGYPPSYREIAGGVGLSGQSHAEYHLTILERKGRISRIPRRPRTVRLVTYAPPKVSPKKQPEQRRRPPRLVKYRHRR
jgi:SOS-response transcriptional repressor LexA